MVLSYQPQWAWPGHPWSDLTLWAILSGEAAPPPGGSGSQVLQNVNVHLVTSSYLCQARCIYVHVHGGWGGWAAPCFKSIPKLFYQVM